MTKIKFKRNESILKKVQGLLKEKGKTFFELAGEVDYTDTGLRRAFNNNSLSIETLDKIAKVLGVNFTYFFEAEMVKRIKNELKNHPDKNPPTRPFFDDVCDEVLEGMKLEEAIRFVLGRKDFLDKQVR